MKAARYAAAALIVALLAFAAVGSGVRFSHRLHVSEMEIACFSCHAASETSTLSSDSLVGGHDACGECHEVDDNCETCHEGEPGVRPRERDLYFPHKSHLLRGAECVHCHVGIERAEALVGVPPMENCFACHDGVINSARCGLCHKHVDFIITQQHPDGWLREHSLVVSRPDEPCGMSCHTDESFCVECHIGDNLAQKTHPLGWVRVHGQQARRKTLECASCHEPEAFCSPCHAENLVMPWQHSTALWRELHSDEARRDVEYCAACHETSEPICTRCHADRRSGRGNDLNIHPPGFSPGHGPWHDDPSYQCFLCHSSSIGFCGYCHEER
jgi:hypothetical protein